jgi:ATP-binding cassette subfamily B protein
MENGTIVEQGCHDELLAMGGFYQNLWQVQAGERLFAS